MRWALNNEIEDLSKTVNNPLKGEKDGVCQNIKTFLTGVERCTSSDIAKSESCLNNISNALNTASDIQASDYRLLTTPTDRSKPWKTWGNITERRRRELSRGSGGMLPREILEISLSENVFPWF